MGNKIPKVIREWIEALRSGDYEQGKSALCQTVGSREHFCCLGVLADIAITGDWEYRGPQLTSSRKEWAIQGEETIMPKKLRDRLNFDINLEDRLMSLNDDGASFDEIATFIEDYYTAPEGQLPLRYAEDQRSRRVAEKWGLMREG